MKYLLLIITLVYIGCDTDTSTKELSIKRKPINEALILNIAFNEPETDPKFTLFSSIDTGYNWEKKIILSNHRELYDSLLNITMCLYKWTLDYGQSFPKNIIYINNNNDFEYAFSFRDEFYYYLVNNEQNPSNKLVSYFNSQRNFESQINLITNQLKINRKDKTNELKHFLKFFADSLMGMKEITARDTLLLRQISREQTDKTCKEAMKFNIDKIINSLNNHSNEKYNRSQVGTAMWKFDITFYEDLKNDTLLHIKPTFLNKECYKLWFW